eukprot:6179891-Pleurochrysis_carterae.AAC.4
MHSRQHRNESSTPAARRFQTCCARGGSALRPATKRAAPAASRGRSQGRAARASRPPTPSRAPPPR